MRRQEKVGTGDPVLSTTVLGMLFARKQITQEQYDAGETYAKYYCRAFGRPYPKASRIGEVVHEHITSEDTQHDFDQAEAKKRYMELDKELRSISRKVRDTVCNTAIFDRYPYRNKTALSEGLRVLQEVL